MIRFFLFSILVLILQSCGSYKPDGLFKEKNSTAQNLYFADQNQEYVYTALISAFGKEITGILVLKPLGNDSHRVVLTTDFGNTLLDLTLNKDGYIKNYAIPDLDKKIVLNILSSDFKLLVKQNWTTNAEALRENEKVYRAKKGNKNYYLTYQNQELKQLIYAKRKKKVVLDFKVTNHNNANEIQLQHFNFNLKIELKAIEM